MSPIFSQAVLGCCRLKIATNTNPVNIEKLIEKKTTNNRKWKIVNDPNHAAFKRTAAAGNTITFLDFLKDFSR